MRALLNGGTLGGRGRTVVVIAKLVEVGFYLGLFAFLLVLLPSVSLNMLSRRRLRSSPTSNDNPPS
jgi:hypothetical protein